MSAAGEAALARLAALARTRGVAVRSLVVSWIGERFLHRLAGSAHAGRMVVKGGHLFGIWDGDDRRATGDVDLAHHDELPASALAEVLRAVASVELADGVRFDAASTEVGPSFAGLPRGARAVVPARVGTAAVRLKVDVTYGQPITPGPELRWHHGLGLDLPPALLSCTPKETMVSEKLAIAVEFGSDNSRIRDYHDLWHLSRTRSFGGGLAQSAVRRTFAARTAGAYLARQDGYWSGGLSPGFATPARRRAWGSFCEEHARGGDLPGFDEVVGHVSAFAIPLLASVRDERRLGTWSARECRWRAPRDVREAPR